MLYKNPSHEYAHVDSICLARGSAQLLSLHKFRSRGHEMRTYPRVRTEKHHTSKPKQKKRTSATEFDVVGNNQPQKLRREPEPKCSSSMQVLTSETGQTLATRALHYATGERSWN